MGVPKRLTEMQMRFAEFVVFGGVDGPMTQGESAIAARSASDSFNGISAISRRFGTY